MSENEECTIFIENSREEAGTEDNNLQLFNIIDKLKKNDYFEGNSIFNESQLKFEELVEGKAIDINRTDKEGNSPLHYTVKYKWDKLTKLLLENGAYIGVKNASGELPIKGISYNILSEFFDSRITSDIPEIKLDYSFLIMKPIKENKKSTNTNQFEPVQFISESKELGKLILHPLIHYLIWTKSGTLPFLFIWNGITLLLSLLSIIHITFFRQTPTADESMFLFILKISGTCSCIFVNLIMLIFKILDLIISSVRWGIIPMLCNGLILASLFTILVIDEDDWRKSLTAGCILLIALDMNQLIMTFPTCKKICVHFIMLKTITFRFMKVLLFYLIILSAFSLSFYTLDDKASDDPTKTSQLYQFFVRVIGMMVGELSLTFDDRLAVYYILLLVFIFMITIVLINLLNGLAITDIGKIHKRAELFYLTYRVHLIASCNNFFTDFVWLRQEIFRKTRNSEGSPPRECFHVDAALCRYVKEIKIQPNRNLTTVINVLKPTDWEDVDEIKWNKINKNILTELKMANKEKELKNMVEQIYQQVLVSRQI